MSLTVEQLKDILLTYLDEERNVTDMTGALDVITKLQTVPITRESLEATRLGLLVNKIRRQNQDKNPQLGKLCRILIKDWQKFVSPATSQLAGGNGNNRLGVSPAPERLATPSGGSRTTTPRQQATSAAAARLIAENSSGALRCSPSPAASASTTPKLQPSTPVVVNGKSASSASVSPAEAQFTQRSQPSTSSYAPPEQQQQSSAATAATTTATTNGPSALKIRIKYGSADQQASIVREIDSSSSPRLTTTSNNTEHAQPTNEPSSNAVQGAEEVANKRKRKHAPPEQVSRSLGLVNGGSKSVSPCTSAVPSPAPSLINNVNSPTSVPPPPPPVERTSSPSVVVVAPKSSKKSKSSSPDNIDGGSNVAASANLSQRPKLKSTAELVAEMTSSYPETMSISLKNVVRRPTSPPVGATSGRGTSAVMASILAAEAEDDSDGGGRGRDDDSMDADYKEPTSKKAKALWTSTMVSGDGGDHRHNSGHRQHVNRTELLDRYLRDHSSGGDTRRSKRQGKNKDVVDSPSSVKREPVYVRPPIDWYSSVQLPPVDFSVLSSLVEEEDEDGEDGVGEKTSERGEDVCDNNSTTIPTTTKTMAVESNSEPGGKYLDSFQIGDDTDDDDARREISSSTMAASSSSTDEQTSTTAATTDGVQWRSRLLKTTIRDHRRVLAMPYIDIGLPDFLEYGYTNKEQYLAHWSDREVIGYPVNFKDGGFGNLDAMIQGLPDVIRVSTTMEGRKLFAVSNEETQHMASLIGRTKSTRIGRFGGTEQVRASEEDIRAAQERRRTIERRLIEIVGRSSRSIPFGDIQRKYRSTYGESFDPKADFKCLPKIVFTTKLHRHFIVEGSGGRTGAFSVRLRDASRGLVAPNTSAFAQSNLRFGGSFGNNQQDGQYQQAASTAPKPSNFGGGGQMWDSRPRNRGRPYGGGNANRSQTYNPPRFGAGAGSRNTNNFTTENKFNDPLPPRFGGPSSIGTARSSTYPPPYPSFAPMTVTVSNNAAQGIRSISSTMPKPTPLRECQPYASNGASGEPHNRSDPVKNKIKQLLEAHPMGINLSQLSYHYWNLFKEECPVDADFLRHACTDFCNWSWNELTHSAWMRLKPTVTTTSTCNAFSTMSTIRDALPSIRPSGPQLPRMMLVSPSKPIVAATPSLPPPVVQHKPTAAPAEDEELSWDEMRIDIAKILYRHRNGIPYLSFARIYREETGGDLNKNLARFNLLSLNEFIQQVPDLCRIEKRSNGEIILFEKGGRLDRPLIDSSEVERFDDLDGLVDEVWILAMNSPNSQLYLSCIVDEYQKTFGKPFPLKDIEGTFSFKLFDCYDRFTSGYTQGAGPFFNAMDDYKPKNESLMRYIRKTPPRSVVLPQFGSDMNTDFVPFGQTYVLQSLPGLELVVLVDENEASRQYQVYVAQVETPSRFFVQLLSTAQELEAIVNEMTDYYSTHNVPIPTSGLKIGQVCTVPYDDGLWYRGVIKGIDGSNVHVTMVDYGTEATVAPGVPCYLLRRFFELPSQAIESRLASLMSSSGEWSVHAGEVMTDFCGDNPMTIQLCKIENGLLHVYLFKMVDGNDIYLNDMLVDSNLARLTDETSDEAQSRSSPEEDMAAGGENGSKTTAPDVDELFNFSFEQAVVGQLRKITTLDDEDLEVVTHVKVFLSRKQIALRQKLASCGADEKLRDTIMEKLGWAKENILWLTEQQQNINGAA